MSAFGTSPADALIYPVFNALPHPIFTLSDQNQFEQCNAAAEAFFQTSAAKLRGRSFSSFLTVDSPIHSLLRQVRDSGSPVNEYRIDISSPKLGSDRWVDVYVAPVVELAGRLVVMLQARSMADTLDRQLTHRGAARTVTGLASMLGHEIKNPLSGIRGAAQLLEANGSEDDRALTRLITAETDRIVRLVDRMEVFSDERPIERDPVNIHSIFEQVKAVARNGFAKDMEIVELYDPSLPPVPGDRDQLVQVFINLVKNACEAMSSIERPVLTFSTAFRPGMRITARGSSGKVSLPIALTVSDNGPGIPEDILSYIYDPFISTKPNGSGLGLALVAKIVGDHGGIVSCDRSKGITSFTVLMPTWRNVEVESTADG